MMLIVSAVILLVLIAIYWRMFFSYFSGWNRLLREEENKPGFVPEGFFTLVVPFRNEAIRLPEFLESLQQQSIELNRQEVIFVNDHSDDQSREIVEKWISSRNFATCLDMGEGESGKKQAIYKAISASKGRYIITTDADTVAEPEWLETIGSFAFRKASKLVSGPVKIQAIPGFFNQWQSLEFSGLIAIGAASMSNGRPNMCNGANLCYEKSAFFEVGGFKDNEHLLSGDDEFLMHKIKARYPEQVSFLFSPHAMVKTWPQEGWKNFIRQRIRWTSKATHYRDKTITTTLSLAYIFTLSIVVFAVAGIWQPHYLFLAGAALLAKILPEFFFFRKTLPFFGHNDLKKIILPSEFLHIVYIVLIGVLGTFAGYNWKGRSQK